MKIKKIKLYYKVLLEAVKYDNYQRINDSMKCLKKRDTRENYTKRKRKKCLQGAE